MSGEGPTLLGPGQASLHLADPNQAHAFVVHSSRLGDRQPDPLGERDHDVLRRNVAGDPLARTEAVLERHDDAVGTEQRRDGRRNLLDVRGLGGDHPDVRRSGVGG